MFSLDALLLGAWAQGFKRRNACFDRLFYDVDALSADEQAELSPLADREGSIVCVPPRDAGHDIKHYPDVRGFLAAEHGHVRAIVVAGVGSSVLGTAALARNVADAYGFEVAGIVSGYGASDLVTEALGGWFFYGALDELRHELRERLRLLHGAGLARVTGRTSAAAGEAFATNDVHALETILDAAPPGLELLLGHSKGSLLLDYALERFASAQGGRDHAYFRQLRVVTLGAVTDLPARFAHAHQFIGALDWFGGVNSRSHVRHRRVPHAWHHLNTRLPFHLSVVSALREHVPLAAAT